MYLSCTRVNKVLLLLLFVKCPVILICPPGDGIEVVWLM